jgi:hypothetical protein
VIAATGLAVAIAVVSITAQYGVFNEGFEGEIWELVQTVPVDNGFASGVAWVNGELYVLDYYNAIVKKFTANYVEVPTIGADWHGAPGSPTNPSGEPTPQWLPNDVIQAKYTLNGNPAQQDALLITDAAYNRIFLFTPAGAHLFTAIVPDSPSVEPYTRALNSVAMTVGSYFALDTNANTLSLVGSLALAYPERYGLNSGAGITYKDRTFGPDQYGRYDLGQPDAELVPLGFEVPDPEAVDRNYNGVTGVAFGSDGRLFVLDSFNGRVNAYTPAFAHIFEFGPAVDPLNATEGDFLEPFGISFWPSADGDRLLVTDPYANRAVVYRPQAATLQYLFKLDGLGAVDGLPHQASFDPVNGRVAVSDSVSNQVHIFQTPSLAVFDLQTLDVTSEEPVETVCVGAEFKVRFSITVPAGRSAVQNITPQLTINGQPAAYSNLVAAGTYGIANVGDVNNATANPPLTQTQVLTYTYTLQAPPPTGELAIVASALGFTTAIGQGGQYAALTDVLATTNDFPALDCGIVNDPPTIAATVTTPPQPNGWTQVGPGPFSFPITLTADDTDSGIVRIEYQLTGTNQGLVTSVPVTGAPAQATTVVTLTNPGPTTITYRTLDTGFAWSEPGVLEVKLDNDAPQICLLIPYGEPIPITDTQLNIIGYKYWWNTPVSIAASTTDTWDTNPGPQFVAPIPGNMNGNQLIFNYEGYGQFSTVTSRDHVGHETTLASNSPLNVCGPGTVGTNINIDMTNPTASADLPDIGVVYQGPTTVQLTGFDPPAATSTALDASFSDVRYIEWRVVGETSWNRVAGSATVILTESTNLEIRAIDWATNVGGTITKNYTVNRPPVAVDDFATTDEDVPVTLNIAPLVLLDNSLLADDTDLDGDTLVLTSVQDAVNGSVINNGNGTVTFTPAPNYSGPASYTYTISDGRGGTDTATVQITIVPVNDPPVAEADSTSTNEDQPVTITGATLLAEDTDIDNDALTITSFQDVVNGTVVWNTEFTFTPAPNYSGTGSFTYTISDGNGGTDTATVTIAIVPQNDPPVAVDDATTTSEDAPVTLTAAQILLNDSDPESDPLTITSVQQPVNGSVALNGDGSVTFTPASGYSGPATYTYTISDGNGGSDTATVRITIDAENDPPDAVDDAATTNEDTPIDIPLSALLANDRDPENDVINVVSAQSPVNGTVTFNTNSTVTFTPAPNYSGPASFTYTIIDNQGGSDTATVNITVIPVPEPPVAVNDSFAIGEDVSLLLNPSQLLGNDSDPENDTLTIVSVQGAVNGVVSLNLNGTILFIPGLNFYGTASFTYTITDGNGGFSTATVTITLNALNDPPDAVNDTASTTEDTPVTIAPASLLANDSDPDGNSVSITSVQGAVSGSVILNGNGTVTFSPALNFTGVASFTYTITDGQGEFDTATVFVTVTGSQDPPVANDDTASTGEDVPVTITAATLLGNDTDPDGDTLSITSVQGAVNGSVVLNGNGTVTFTPAPNFYGTASFTYTITDGQGGFSTATVTVTVTPVNDPPVAVDDTASTTEDTPVNIAASVLLANDSDPDNDTLTLVSVQTPVNGTVSLNAGVVTFTPQANYSGPASFTYTISDGNGGTDTATVNITITAVNDPPVANPDVRTVVQGSTTVITVLANDTDVDGGLLTITTITPATNGTASITGSTITYVASPTFAGTDTFTYTISDGNGGTATTTVTISVTTSNHPPHAGDDAVTTSGTTAVSISVLTNDSDLDGNTLNVLSYTPVTVGTLTQTGNVFTYTAPVGFVGTATFTYTITDGFGGTDTATVTITVTAHHACTTSGFTTFTQGGWGASPSGNNPAMLLKNNFASVYPSGVSIGAGTKVVTFTTSDAIKNFLPAGGTAGVLAASATNPKKTAAGVFAGQVLAMQLNLDFSNAGITKADLGGLVYHGYTVTAIMAAANHVLGGNTAVLAQYGFSSISQLNNVIDSFNRNFDNGTVNLGVLSCPSTH